ncbi:hypothetical protein QTP88_012776 [Uroleucon formosanum]
MALMKSNRNECIFTENGFIYLFDKLSSDSHKKCWRCKYKRECKARVHTGIDSLEVPKRINEHTHDSEAAKVEAMVVINRLKNRVTETMKPTSTVIKECISGLSEAAKSAISRSQALKKAVRRKRKEIQVSPNAPQDLLTLEIPDSFKVYSPSTGLIEPFLLDGSGPGVDCISIFGRNRSLDILYNSKVWYRDGTFKIAPGIFSQVFVILAKALGGVHPLIYTLLPNKQEKTYTPLFKMLNQLKSGLNPTSIFCDFEQAILKSIKTEYPNTEIYGYLYHFSRNVYKNIICDLGIVSNYRNNSDLSIFVKMVVSFTYIPINDIDLEIELLSGYLPDELQPLLDWF